MANIEVFREGLRQLGHVEGQNVEFEYKSVQGAAQFMELANGLVQRKVDVIVTAGPGVAAAMKATKTIPIVFSFSGDPVEAWFCRKSGTPGKKLDGCHPAGF